MDETGAPPGHISGLIYDPAQVPRFKRHVGSGCMMVMLTLYGLRFNFYEPPYARKKL